MIDYELLESLLPKEEDIDPMENIGRFLKAFTGDFETTFPKFKKVPVEFTNIYYPLSIVEQYALKTGTILVYKPILPRVTRVGGKRLVQRLNYLLKIKSIKALDQWVDQFGLDSQDTEQDPQSLQLNYFVTTEQDSKLLEVTDSLRVLPEISIPEWKGYLLNAKLITNRTAKVWTFRGLGISYKEFLELEPNFNYPAEFKIKMIF